MAEQAVNQNQAINQNPLQANDRQRKLPNNINFGIQARYIVNPCMPLIKIDAEQMPEVVAGRAQTDDPADTTDIDNWQLTDDQWDAIGAEVARLGYKETSVKNMQKK